MVVTEAAVTTPDPSFIMLSLQFKIQSDGGLSDAKSHLLLSYKPKTPKWMAFSCVDVILAYIYLLPEMKMFSRFDKTFKSS